MKCIEACRKYQVSCPHKECRLWINYEGDLNCTLEAIEKANASPMTLKEIGIRCQLTTARIHQIETAAFKKLKASSTLPVIQ